MRHNKTTDRHGNGADDERPSGDDCGDRQFGKAASGEVKHEIHQRQSEERNVPESVQPSLVACITTQPFFAMKTQPEQRARDESEENPEPGKLEIELGDVRVHVCTTSRITQLASHALIDKSNGSIVYFDV